MYIYIYIYICIICIYTYIYTCTYIMHTYMYVCVCISLSLYIYIYIYIHMYIRTYTHMYTHTHISLSLSTGQDSGALSLQRAFPSREKPRYWDLRPWLRNPELWIHESLPYGYAGEVATILHQATYRCLWKNTKSIHIHQLFTVNNSRQVYCILNIWFICINLSCGFRRAVALQPSSKSCSPPLISYMYISYTLIINTIYNIYIYIYIHILYIITNIIIIIIIIIPDYVKQSKPHEHLVNLSKAWSWLKWTVTQNSTQTVAARTSGNPLQGMALSSASCCWLLRVASLAAVLN